MNIQAAKINVMQKIMKVSEASRLAVVKVNTLFKKMKFTAE